LSALQDQHLGGLVMWLPTHMFLLLALGITFFKWFTNSVAKQKASQLEGDSSLSRFGQAPSRDESLVVAQNDILK
jgi:cytochrome c oxidase assembly factor CtaG